MKKSSWFIQAFIVVACFAVAGLWLGNIVAPQSDNHPQSVQSHLDRRDFSLTDTSGRKVSLASYQGKWLLMFFGFTNCPEACPTAMLKLGVTLREMGSAAANIQPIFITIDPERDAPNLLREYLSNFGDNIVGLSGTADETSAITKSYGVYYRKRPMEDGNYTMDHSTALYLVSPTGAYLRPFRADVESGDLAQELISATSKKQ